MATKTIKTGQPVKKPNIKNSKQIDVAIDTKSETILADSATETSIIAPSLYEPHVNRITKSLETFTSDIKLKRVEDQLISKNAKIQAELSTFDIKDEAGAQLIGNLLVQNKKNIKTVLALFNPIWEAAKSEYETIRGRRDSIGKVQAEIENAGKIKLRDWETAKRLRLEEEARLARMEQIRIEEQNRRKAEEEARQEAEILTLLRQQEAEQAAKLAAQEREAAMERELSAATSDEEIEAIFAKYGEGSEPVPVVVETIRPEDVYIPPPPVPAPMVVSFTPKVAGNSLVERWEAQLDDKAVFLWNVMGVEVERNADGKLYNRISKTLMPEPNEQRLEWIEVDMGKVKKQANFSKQHTNIPGVRVWREDMVRTSSR